MIGRITRRALGAATVAVALGLFIAYVDVLAPFGDDSAQATILLWLLASGVLGLIEPRQPWRWAALIGPWVSVVHVARHALAQPDSIHPNTYATILVLLPVSLAVCLIGAYGGSWTRRLSAPTGTC